MVEKKFVGRQWDMFEAAGTVRMLWRNHKSHR